VLFIDFPFEIVVDYRFLDENADKQPCPYEAAI